MKIYNYHPETREYLGSADADESPLEAGQFLIPAHATTVEPPSVDLDQAAVYVNGEWNVQPDHRRVDLYSVVDGAPVKVTDIGQLPSNTTTLPRPSRDHVWSEAGWSVDAAARKARVQRELVSLVQSQLNGVARERGYDNIVSLCSYATSGVERFATEARAGIMWRDNVWATCYQILADVEAGDRPEPTPEQLLAELPTIAW
jgi:hypothetical protein